MLFVSYSHGAANVDHAKSLKINNKYTVCQLYLASVGDKIAKPDKVAETHCRDAHVYYSIGKYEIASVFSHIL